ncbi:MAG: hypothetical protein WC420_03090 [Candidatus Paceibacterota bacterium]|jgi:hypothetical protein
MKEPNGPHVKLIYPKKTAESHVRDRSFVQGNNLKIKWLKAIDDQPSEVHIICTTPKQRKAVVDKIGDPIEELVIKNYLSHVFNKVPKGCKSTLTEVGAMVFSRGNITQVVFPSPKSYASFEKALLGRA